MVSPTRIVVAFLLMLLTSQSWAANLEVTLDTDEVAAGDTVNLTLTVDEQAFGKSPDFEPLKRDFEILSNRQSSQYSMVNGKITSSTSWILTLLPKKDGFIAIPALDYDTQSSKPIKLHVTQRRQADPANSQDVIFLDAQVDKKEVYVQEQVIYTVRLYRRIDLHESSYTPPKVDDAVMEPLGNQREYTSTVNGRSYKIIELRYVVFPQKRGELVIPPAEIVGTIFLANNRSFLMDPFNGKQIRRISPEISIHVKPQPDSYPAGEPWLPARSLSLTESWLPENGEFKVGEPVTRRITMEAEGLAPSVLPPIKTPVFDTMKVYPEPADTQSNIGPRGILSTRKENLAMIATAKGAITLPPVEVTWWDVDEEKVKKATLPGRTVNITGTASHAQTDAATLAPVIANPSESAPQSINAETNHTWQWIAVIAVILWLLTLLIVGLLLWKRRRALEPAEPATENPLTREAEKAARNQLQNACAANDAHAARSALIELYRQVYRKPHIHNLDDVLHQTPQKTLENALRQLDAQLYRRTGAASAPVWQGADLPALVQSAMDQHSKSKAQQVTHLEPLFPA